MTNWQFIAIIGTFVLSFFGFILTNLETARSTQTTLNEQFTAFRNEMKAELETLGNEIRQNDRRYEERFARIEAILAELPEAVHRQFGFQPPRPPTDQS